MLSQPDNTWVFSKRSFSSWRVSVLCSLFDRPPYIGIRNGCCFETSKACPRNPSECDPFYELHALKRNFFHKRCLKELPCGLEISTFAKLVAFDSISWLQVFASIWLRKNHDSPTPNLETDSTDCCSKLFSLSSKTMETVLDHFVINRADLFDCTRTAVVYPRWLDHLGLETKTGLMRWHDLKGI